MRLVSILLLGLIISCQPSVSTRYFIGRYGIIIRDTCWFCGKDDQWRLTNYPFTTHEGFFTTEPLKLYHISRKWNQGPSRDSIGIQYDSTAYALTRSQADSLFYLANAYLERVEVTTPDERQGTFRTDQGTLSVKVCREFRTKEATAYLGYDRNDEAARRALMRYIARMSAKR